MSKVGKQIIKDLQDMLDGKPMKQTIVRRMKVKGKEVFARETFVAPVQLKRKRRKS